MPVDELDELRRENEALRGRVAQLARTLFDEQRYRNIVETTSEGVWVYDADGVTTFMNARMAQMLGYSVDEVIGKPLFFFMDASRYAEAQERLERRRRGEVERSDFTFRRSDRADIRLSIQANPLFSAEGVFRGGLLLSTDVSAQRRAEENQARLAAIVDSCEDAIVTVDLEGVVTSWNRGAERLFGHGADEVVGKSSRGLASTCAGGHDSHVIEDLGPGDVVRRYEGTLVRVDGSEVIVDVTLFPLRDASGVVVGRSKIARDVTAERQTEASLRRIEQQFRQAQKMEAVGRLAGGVAHDFNNLLSVILCYASAGPEELAPGHPLRDDLEEIERAAERGTELARQLLSFSRQQLAEPRVVDVDQVVSGMQSMMCRLLGEDIELTVRSEHAYQGAGAHDRRTGPLQVLADRGQLEQVIMNLAVNARDAMPRGGALVLETEHVTADVARTERLVGVPRLPPGHYVRLAVRDTGVGMDAPTKAQAFDPFFTTKERGKGTGLGLSTVFRIVEESGGHIALESEPGRGSCFSIYLPHTDRERKTAGKSVLPVDLHGSETILLVEDDEQLRGVAGDILRGSGYAVLEGSNGGDALASAGAFESDIHLLLTDVVMPRMDGRRLADELAYGRSEMRVLFMSGYTDDAIVQHGVLAAGVALLRKPFTPSSLLRSVREVLDAGRGPPQAIKRCG